MKNGGLPGDEDLVKLIRRLQSRQKSAQQAATLPVPEMGLGCRRPLLGLRHADLKA